MYVCARELEVKIQPVLGLGVETDVPEFVCDTTTEVDPRQEPQLEYLFEEEKLQKILQEQEEARLAAEALKVSFEERVRDSNFPLH